MKFGRKPPSMTRRVHHKVQLEEAFSVPRVSNIGSDRVKESGDPVNCESSHTTPRVTSQTPIPSSSSGHMDLTCAPVRVRLTAKRSLLKSYEQQGTRRSVTEHQDGDGSSSERRISRRLSHGLPARSTAQHRHVRHPSARCGATAFQVSFLSNNSVFKTATATSNRRPVVNS